MELKAYTAEELKVVTEAHANWRLGEPEGKMANLSWANLSWANLSRADLSRANLSGANLSGANLSGANLSRANLSWQSHDLIAEILRRAAGNDMEKRSAAGLILMSRDLCWPDLLAIKHPQEAWVIGELSKWVKKDQKDVPDELMDAITKLYDGTNLKDAA